MFHWRITRCEHHSHRLAPAAAAVIACWLPAIAFSANTTQDESRPNVVLIMTDNHGAWTLGCYGNRDIRTPHIDQLAAEGTLFRQAFASNPVCSPTRATCLTGLIPSQHGVHCFLFGGRLQIGPQARCTLDEFTSLPEILRAAGYSCGLVGKWHLGDNLHPQEGFDDYWITMPHGGTSTFYDAQIIENEELRTEPTYLTDFWTDHAVRFLQQRSVEKKPFFLFLSYNGPYALSRLLLREGRNRHAEFYRDKTLPSFPREPTHPWQFSNLDYHNNPVSIRRVATEVSGVDDGVGRVMQTLETLGLDDDTIVIFLADQGWVGGQGGFFGMGDHTRPLTARDGMMQIPMIWRHPGHIAAGGRSGRLVANYDLLPTLLNYLGLADQIPAQPASPGIDFSSELTSPGQPPSDNRPIFYEFENLRCIRTRRYKYVHRHPNGPHELFDLSRDPDEFNNLIASEAYAPLRERLRAALKAFFDRHAVARYDMWNGGGSQTRTFVGIDEEIAQRSPVEPPALPADFAQPPINVPTGFSVELAAGPPLVTHPTLACLDDRGRLFVCNNAGVNMSAGELEENLPNSIRLLEDTDNDGRFDRSTVFADQMTYPMGGAWHNGALYVASPPFIWRLEDTDGDGVADKREKLVSRFGYTGNAASIHGCFLGPDGRLYWCDGYHGHEFRDADGGITSKREGSYLFSCRTDGTDVRIHCGGGMDNPVEVDFTGSGEMLGTCNIFYTRPRVDTLVHWLYGGAYPHRQRVLEELKVTGDVLGPVHHFGHVAISGMTRYRSGAMDHRWRDNIFATFFNSGKVVRVELQRKGASFEARQREFLTCDNRDFHPTDVLEDADGSLLVVDTGGWFYRGCPTSQLSKPEILGAIYRVRRDEMTTLPDPWGKRIAWGDLDAASIVAHLNDTRFQVRTRAIEECRRRGPEMLPQLERTIRVRDIRQRRNALWALTQIIGDEPENSAARALVRTALTDRDPEMRQTACRSLATYPDPEALPGLIACLQDNEAAVRREAATAVGRVGDATAVPSLLSALSRAVDRTEEHAITYALIEINSPDSTSVALKSKSPFVRRNAMVALDQMDQGTLDPLDVLGQLESADVALQSAALRILQRDADRYRRNGDPVLPGIAALVKRLLQSSTTPDSQQLLRSLVATFAGDARIGDLIGQALNKQDTDSALRSTLLRGIGDASQLTLHTSWTTPLRRELLSTDTQRSAQAIEAVSGIASTHFDPVLSEIATGAQRPPELRNAAIESLARRNPRLSASLFAILLKRLSHGTPAEAAHAARIIGSAALTADQLIEVAPQLTTAGPMELRELIRPYQRNNKLEVAGPFLNAVNDARSLSTLPPTEFSDIIKRYPAELRERANAVLERLRQLDEQKVSRLDRLIPRLEQGNAERGRTIFFGTKSKCSTCHRVGSEGTAVGPELTTIGSNRSANDLLESIVFPSASIVRQYEAVTVLTENGRLHTGLITRETADSVWLQPQTGESQRLARDQIEEITPATESLMPRGLDEALNEQELADVIAWLLTLRS